MEHTFRNNLLTISCLRNMYVLDKYDFRNLISDFYHTFYGKYSIGKKYQKDKTIHYPNVENVSFEELIAYFMPLLCEGFEHNKGQLVGLNNVLIVTARHAILKNLNNLI